MGQCARGIVVLAATSYVFVASIHRQNIKEYLVMGMLFISTLRSLLLSLSLLLAGVEVGMRQMRKGGFRRMVLSPQLGPPTGVNTFFLPK